jgi:hypothetical protein
MVELIPGLPPALAHVPDTLAAWEAWRDMVLAYRVLIREQADADETVRAEVSRLCAADAAYEMCVMGCVYEPRERVDRPAGWRPMIPYAFQVTVLRFIDEVYAAMPGTPGALLGRGDGVIEKARGMAGSWTVCAWAAHAWRHKPAVAIGLMSYKEDLVESADNPDALFYKVEGYLGISDKVPETIAMELDGEEIAVPMRAPAWHLPKGFSDANNRELILSHPTRANVIVGYTTTERTTTGGRLSILFMDEGAKFKAFRTVWNSSSAVTDHRLSLSSADLTYGTGFRDIARAAERAQKSGGPGPAFLRVSIDLHPERDEIWRTELEARHSTDPFAALAFAREYELDYEAGHGAHIYTRAQEIEPVEIVFHPNEMTLDFCLDPGIRDMCAFHLVTHDAGTGRYGVWRSYAKNGVAADFYASLVIGQELGHYDYTDEELELMEDFARYGRYIRYWVGDPAGKARSQATATSFYDEFKRATGELTEGRRKIAIWSSDKPKYKQIGPRHDALRWLLPMLDFNETPQTRRTLEAVRDHRFAAEREGAERAAASTLPIRTWGHDRVTALEFYACHRRLGGDAARAGQRAAAQSAPRFTMSGKPITRARASSVWTPGAAVHRSSS